jgi:hypothetical protein
MATRRRCRGSSLVGNGFYPEGGFARVGAEARLVEESGDLPFVQAVDPAAQDLDRDLL